MDTKTRVYTVSEITQNIKFLIENRFPPLWLEGEVSNYRTSQMGHTYFTLRDAFSQIKAVYFRGKKSLHNPRIELRDGLQIYVYGKLTVYEAGGEYQILVEKWEPKGLGVLQLALEELKRKLLKEGLFDEKHKKPLPILPQTVGVITSPTGAAIRDIINVINRRFSNINILLYPVRVQGEGAAEEIAEAIDYMNTLSDIDVLIVGRGGGSIEDLWAFNEECVARSIFRSKIPIISAVGHEIDYTIADLVADKRAPTPSAAAELVVSKKTEFLDKIDFLLHKLNTAIDLLLKHYREKLNLLTTSYVFKEPENALRQYTQKIDELFNRMDTHINHHFLLAKHHYESLHKRLESLNPKSILKRGYSITTDSETGKIIKSSKHIRKGSFIKTILAEGTLLSKVEKK